MFAELKPLVQNVDVVYTVNLESGTKALLVMVEIDPDKPRPTEAHLEWLQGELTKVLSELTGVPVRVIPTSAGVWLSFYPIKEGVTNG